MKPTKGFNNFIRLALFAIPIFLLVIFGLPLWIISLGHITSPFNIAMKMMPEDEESAIAETPTKHQGLMTHSFKETLKLIGVIIFITITGALAMILFIPTLGNSWKIFSDFRDKYQSRMIADP